MGEYYSDFETPESKKSQRSWLMWFLDSVMTLLSLVVAVTMVVTYLIPYVNPATVWFLPALGLAAPVIYVSTVVLALYWIIRWRIVRASLMFSLVLVGLFKVSLFYKPELQRVYGEVTYDRNAFKVMTYNVRSFYGENGQSSVPRVVELINAEDPDLICLQEFNARLSSQCDEFGLLDEKYESAVFGRTQAPDSLYGAPLVIMSKYHILKSGVTLKPNTSVWADVLMGDDTIRIFNNHLRSTAIKASDNEYITSHRFLSDTASEVKIRSIVDRLRENSVLRAGQVDTIAYAIASKRGRRIVCGDFNDTPVSYVYHTMSQGLNDAFRECGSGYSHTFRGFYNTLRIDYVLSSEGLETLSYDVLPVECSDHHPVFVRFKKKPINN